MLHCAFAQFTSWVLPKDSGWNEKNKKQKKTEWYEEKVKKERLLTMTGVGVPSPEMEGLEEQVCFEIK